MQDKQANNKHSAENLCEMIRSANLLHYVTLIIDSTN